MSKKGIDCRRRFLKFAAYFLLLEQAEGCSFLIAVQTDPWTVANRRRLLQARIKDTSLYAEAKLHLTVRKNKQYANSMQKQTVCKNASLFKIGSQTFTSPLFIEFTAASSSSTKHHHSSKRL